MESAQDGVFARRVTALAMLSFVAAGGGYARAALSPVQEAAAAALTLTDHQVAVIQGPAIGLPLALATIPLGVLVDRYSRARLLLALAVMQLTGTLLTAGALGFGTLLIGRGLAGFAGLAIFPVTLSIACDLYSADRRGRATMVISVAQVIGSAAAFLSGGWLLTFDGDKADAWRTTLLYMSVPLVAVAMIALALPEPHRVKQQERSRPVAQYLEDVWRLRAILTPIILGLVMMEIGIGSILIWAGPALMRLFRLGPGPVGTVLALGILVSGCIGPVVGGLLADRCQQAAGPRRTLLVLSALSFMCAPVGLIAYTSSLAAAGAVLFAALTLMIGIAVMGTSLFTIIIPESARGFFLSVLVAANVLFALGLAPLLVSALSAALGGANQLSVALTDVLMIAALVAGVAFVCGRRPLFARRSRASGHLPQRTGRRSCGSPGGPRG